MKVIKQQILIVLLCSLLIQCNNSFLNQEKKNTYGIERMEIKSIGLDVLLVVSFNCNKLDDINLKYDDSGIDTCFNDNLMINSIYKELLNLESCDDCNNDCKNCNDCNYMDPRIRLIFYYENGSSKSYYISSTVVFHENKYYILSESLRNYLIELESKYM